MDSPVAVRTRGKIRRPPSGPKRKQQMKLFFLMLPFVIFFIIINYSQIYGWIYAFIDYRPGIPLFRNAYVGLKNFTDLFSPGSDFLPILRNTLVLSFLCILTTPISAIFAIMLYELNSTSFRRLSQSITSFPNFLSWIIVYSVVFMLLGSQDSFINHLLYPSILSKPLNPLGDPNISWYFVTFLGVVKGTGWGAIIYLAAINGIDPGLYDAAHVDGANKLQRIRYIIVPHLLTTYSVMLLLSVGNLLSAGGFELYYVFQNPLVMDKLNVLDTYVYRVGVLNGNYSFATAVGMFKSIVSVLLLFITNRVAKSIRGEYLI
jgi:putative aldouronate transport system permease protein